MGDESGFSLVSPLKRTWSRRGQTPVQRTSIAHNERLNLLGALLISPNGREIRLSIRSYWHSLTGKEVIAFFKQLLRIVPGHLVLVIDRHPIHKRRLVQDFIAEQKRLHVFYFPVAAPELNPVEYVWTQVSEYTAGTAPHNRGELEANVFAGVARTRNSKRRLLACLHLSQIDWIS
ncbi:MAG: transposase [Nitrospiraceae bacterium]